MNEWLKTTSVYLRDKLTHKHAPWWLGGLAFTESIFFPLPIDPFLVAMVLLRRQQWLRLAFIATVASVIGAIIGYILGLYFFDVIGAKLIALYGAQTQFAHVQSLLIGGTFMFMLIAAVTPIPFKVFVLTAGFMQAPFALFLLASLLGRTLRMFVVAYLTYLFGNRALELIKRYGRYLTVAGLLIVVVYIVYTLLY